MRLPPTLLRAGSVLALIVALGACTPGGQFDPTEALSTDVFNTKKKIQGDREPLFPQGVPGAETGVPPDLVKGYQPAPEPPAVDNAEAAKQATAEEKPKPKPKPKPKVARAPAPAPAHDPAFDQKPASVAPGQSPWPASPSQPAQPAQAPWPNSPGGQAAPAANWPAPPPAGPSAQTNWPNPPSSTH